MVWVPLAYEITHSIPLSSFPLPSNMPHARIKTSVGPVNLYYTISTPATANAKSIDKSLPTVIFLHPAFVAQEVFHCTWAAEGTTHRLFSPRHTGQFADPQLRRFNLIAVDSRCHGATTGRVNDDYGCIDTADDIAKFMVSHSLIHQDSNPLTFGQDVLRLPPCHIVGLSLGSCTALQMAVSHPNKVLSVFMISPHPEAEVSHPG
jgi:pimeloyl-ACP methyl ester carboxylesterase